MQSLTTLGAMLAHRSILAHDNARSDILRSREALTLGRSAVLKGPVKRVLA
jgi:hypothetical protein